MVPRNYECIACRLVALLARALALPEGFLEARFSRPIANVRAVHYLAGQRSDPGQGIFGVGARPALSG
jgi:isopenicillin N synthase-like dioxygenase